MSDFTVEFAADQVRDESSLIWFISLLREKRMNEINQTRLKNTDARQLGSFDPWENLVTDNFLKEMVTWSESTKHSNEHYEKPLNPWTRFAHMILAGIFSKQ
jgi:hypothetical protein